MQVAVTNGHSVTFPDITGYCFRENYGSEGWGFESLRTRQANTPDAVPVPSLRSRGKPRATRSSRYRFDTRLLNRPGLWRQLNESASSRPVESRAVRLSRWPLRRRAPTRDYSTVHDDGILASPAVASRAIRFEVLGPIVVRVGGESIRLGSSPQRRLTAALAMRAGQVLSSDFLIEHLGLSPGAVRTAISRLRRLVGPDVLVTAPPGYLLRTSNSAVETDVAVFERTVDAARRADDDSQTIDFLERARQMWRGEPYEEFGTEAWALSEVTRLRELYAAASEELVETLLRANQHGRAINVLEPLIAGYPFRDRPRGQLMRAYADSGRQADALRAFQTYRLFLVDEVGTEPSAAVVALDRQISAGTLQDRAVVAPTARSTPSSRPTGVVTFLFTDIESSTRMWNDHPSEMNGALARHHVLVLRSIDAHGGAVFTTGGDGFGAAFATPNAAIGAAIDAQRALNAEVWPASVPIRVRMAVHTGVAYERDNDYFGPTLNLTARLMSAARGQQLLLSGAARRLLLDEELPPESNVRSRGPHQLTDIVEPVEVFEVLIVGIRPTDSPLRVPNIAPDTLPALRSTLLGRRSELARIDASLRSNRLVTITGPGGCGKSAVALRAAHLLLDRFGGDVIHVDLSRVDSADTFLLAVAQALRLGREETPSLQSLARACLGRSLLIVLDNAEHIAEHVADLADHLLDIKGPTLLVTSRAPLEVVGEHVERLGPLDEMGLDGRTLAAELFVERASDGGASLDLSVDGLAEIEALCARLDRLPLAIELAAAASTSSSPHQLLIDFERGAGLRKGRRSSRRWTTVDEMVGWSYQLLDPTAQSFMRGLSAFRGGTPIEALEAAWPSTGDAGQNRALPDSRSVVDGQGSRSDFRDAVGGLLRLHLVVADQTPHGVRYRMLETVRAFVLEQAKLTDDWDAVRARHRDWFLTWSERPSRLEQFASLRVARTRHEQLPNLRAALHFSLEQGRFDLVARQAWAMACVWVTVGGGDEGLEWLGRSSPAVSAPGDRLCHDMARFGAALAARRWDVVSSACTHLRELAEFADLEFELVALGVYGVTRSSDRVEGQRILSDAVDRARSTSTLCRQILANLSGEQFLMAGRNADALAVYRESPAFDAADSDIYWAAAISLNHAVAELTDGSIDVALDLARRAAELAGLPELGATPGSAAVVLYAIVVALVASPRDGAQMVADTLRDLSTNNSSDERYCLPIIGAAFVLSVSEDETARVLLDHVGDAGGSQYPWGHAMIRETRRRLADGAAEPGSSSVGPAIHRAPRSTWQEMAELARTRLIDVYALD